MIGQAHVPARSVKMALDQEAEHGFAKQLLEATFELVFIQIYSARTADKVGAAVSARVCSRR